jgi:hypothetical protein
MQREVRNRLLMLRGLSFEFFVIFVFINNKDQKVIRNYKINKFLLIKYNIQIQIYC